jgi:putative hydrolase of the HAD superfamily
MPIIDAVLFDFGGTLDADGIRWAARFHEAYRLAGGTADLPSFEVRFRESDRRLRQQAGIGRLGFRAMVDLQADLLGPLLPDGARVSGRRMADRFYAEALAMVGRNSVLLARLAERWPLGIISNFTGNLARCLEELHLLQHFRVVLDSAVVGREKPDPGLFELALASLRSMPAGTWMVGDNPEADIRPALTLGMSGCWLAERTRPAPPGLVPTARIASLLELEPALEEQCTH